MLRLQTDDPAGADQYRTLSMSLQKNLLTAAVVVLEKE
jgi:hypothetical protein